MGNSTSGEKASRLQDAITALEVELKEEQDKYDRLLTESSKCFNESKQLKEELRQLKQKKLPSSANRVKLEEQQKQQKQREEMEKKQQQMKIDQELAKQRQADIIERLRVLQLEERKRLEEQQAKEREAKRQQQQFMPVPGIRQSACMRQYRKEKELGKGGYGTVNQVCLGSDCKYVMKIQRFDEDVTENEVKMAEYIYKICPRIIPRTYGSWYCKEDGTFHIVSDMFDDNMSNVAQKQFHNALDKRLIDPLVWREDIFFWMFTEDQILQMMAIAEILTNSGIIHADLKPDNFLYKYATHQVVVTDTGLAGFMNAVYAHKAGMKMIWPFNGWPAHVSWGCPMGFIDSDHPWYEYRDFINTWQLAAYFVHYPAIVDLGPAVKPELRYAKFQSGYLGGRRDIANKMLKSCNPIIEKRIIHYAKLTAHLPKYIVQKANLDAAVKRLLA